MVAPFGATIQHWEDFYLLIFESISRYEDGILLYRMNTTGDETGDEEKDSDGKSDDTESKIAQSSKDAKK